MELTVVVIATALLTGIAIAIGLNFVTAERQLRRPPPRWYDTRDPDFRQATGVLLGPSILSGNQVDVLVNGDEIFPAMLSAIRSAEQTITFETFIYWGEIAADFSAELVAAARRGVRVHMLLDWIGIRRMDDALLECLRESGVQLQIYHPLSWYHIARLNNRTHRKLLVIDGRLGFTGGVGIAPPWTGNAHDKDHWRDTHFRVRGPVVAQMQAVFLDNWIKAKGEVLHGDAYFPRLDTAGDMDAQMFGSSPSGGSDSMHLLVMLAITAARKRIDIQNSYFVPDQLTLRALLEARERGVRIRLMVPGPHIDVSAVRYASHASWNQLLQAGVEIFEYLPTMLHCKTMIVDDCWVSVGSANFDTRSFRLNDEANLNVFSEPLAARLTALFEADLAHTRRFVLRRWRRRGTVLRAREWVTSHFRSQL